MTQFLMQKIQLEYNFHLKLGMFFLQSIYFFLHLLSENMAGIAPSIHLNL